MFCLWVGFRIYENIQISHPFVSQGLLSFRNQFANLHWWYRTEVLFKLLCMIYSLNYLPIRHFDAILLLLLYVFSCILSSWKSESAEIADVDPAQVVPNQTSSRTSNHHHGNQKPKSSTNFTIQFRGFINKTITCLVYTNPSIWILRL